MKTSYFAKARLIPESVSIAGKSPDWYVGREYKKLAPKYWFFKEYKETIAKWDRPHGQSISYDISRKKAIKEAQELYTKRYREEVLDKLDAVEVYRELGERAVLLCWETPEKFCHRHLVAKWFKEELGIIVEEY